MASVAPAVGPDTAILPLLNGMRHVDLLQQRFGAGAVLGGLCADLDDARCGGPHPASERLRTCLRSASRTAHRRLASRQLPQCLPAQISAPRQLDDHAGDVGEVGADRRGRRDHLPDARADRRCRCGRCRRCRDGAARRVRGDRTLHGFAPRAVPLERSRAMVTTKARRSPPRCCATSNAGRGPRWSMSWAICCGAAAIPRRIRCCASPTRIWRPTRRSARGSRRHDRSGRRWSAQPVACNGFAAIATSPMVRRDSSSVTVMPTRARAPAAMKALLKLPLASTM